MRKKILNLYYYYFIECFLAKKKKILNFNYIFKNFKINKNLK